MVGVTGVPRMTKKEFFFVAAGHSLSLKRHDVCFRVLIVEPALLHNV